MSIGCVKGSSTCIPIRISHENPPAQRKPHTLTKGCIFFQYTYASCSIHPQYSFLSNCYSGCLLHICYMTHSQQTHNQHTYNGKCIHCVSHCMTAHTREYVLSTPAKPRKNVSNLPQIESVHVEWGKPVCWCRLCADKKQSWAIDV